MKNKRYRVWMAQGYVEDIVAKEVLVVSLNAKPLKVKFVDENNYTLAEFYCDMISGWANVDCITEKNHTLT